MGCRRRFHRSRWLLALGSVLIAAWVLNVSRPGRQAEGCPEGCATADTRQAGPLRVLSLNVLHGFPRFEHLARRLDLIAAEIGRQDADIVCLQEVPWHWGSAARALARQTGLNHLYLRANGNRWALLFEEGEAILSRFPLRDAAAVELAPQAGFFEHRVALAATAVTPWGEVRVFVSHLTAGNPVANRDQVASLADLVAGDTIRPALVAGDFNAREDTPQIQALDWVDAYRVVHPGEEGPTCCIGDLTAGPGELLEKRIDYLFLIPGAGPAEVVSSRRVFEAPFREGDGWLWASDHVGLMAEIDMEP
jgi:endonuclease/exonuclease/phosphatase family metal-dependent hydrolase